MFLLIKTVTTCFGHPKHGDEPHDSNRTTTARTTVRSALRGTVLPTARSALHERRAAQQHG